jgi:hypothetical protein
VDSGRLHTLLWIKNRVISIYSFTLHIPVQSWVIERSRAHYLLCRCPADHDVQQRSAGSLN